MLNSCTFQGRFVKDPELKHVADDKSVVSFTLACDRDFKNKDGERDADFIDCEAWGYDADFIANHFSKGDQIIVHGKLKTRLYEDKDGKTRKSVTVKVDDEYFCGRRSDTNERRDAEEARPSDDVNKFTDVSSDDIPF